MLTRTGANKIFRRILETGGLTPQMEEDVEKLQKHFDECETILANSGEIQDGDDIEEYEFIMKEVAESGDNEFKQKYEELHQRYLDRFFGGSKEDEESEESEDSEEVEENEEIEEKSIDDLFN